MIGASMGYRIIPDNDVYKHNGCNDRSFNPVSEGERQDHDDCEDESQAVRDLPEEDLKDGDFFAVFEAIGTVRGKARGRFVAS
jgi:hypothetical protein